MKENKKIIEEWSEIIDTYPKISINTARYLYEEMDNEIDLSKKKILRDKLITNTLYVVSNFIIRNHFDNLKSSDYDMNDIINICNEIWIEKIDSGTLLDVNNYGNIFDYSFYSEFSEKLLSLKYSISNNTILKGENFSELLYKYIKYSEKKGNVTYNEFIKFMIDEVEYDIYTFINASSVILNTYNIFETILKDDFINGFSKTKLDNLKYVLVNNSISSLAINTDDIYLENILGTTLERIYNQNFLNEILNDDLLTNLEKNIIKKRFGLGNSECYTLGELSKENGVTIDIIRQREMKALRKLRISDKFKKSVEF